MLAVLFAAGRLATLLSADHCDAARYKNAHYLLNLLESGIGAARLQRIILGGWPQLALRGILVDNIFASYMY
jgi:hypothetical protein